MTGLKRRVITGLLGLALTFALVACDSDDPATTTPPGDSDTTAPVGS